MKKIYSIMFGITLVTMLISLYFSTYGDPIADITANTLFQWPWLEPCHLCRWGRILMYPTVLLSLLWIIRGGKEYLVAIWSFASLWIILASYHYYIQFFHIDTSYLCSAAVPCNEIQWQIFWFVTLPLLEIILFIGLLFISIVASRQHNKTLSQQQK